ncbi:MAG: glycoside hydrolase family 104 protein [Patescibacteria group bacterium]|nr:glycoside hydrolase family 104 protein [Patescibacteria group bacterium]
MIDPKYKAFLDMIAWSEGTSTEDITVNDGYDVIVTGEIPNLHGTLGSFQKHEEIFSDYTDHPFAGGRPAVLVRPASGQNKAIYSTASGRYQIILHTWQAYKFQLDLPDFSPASQDAVALELIKERGALLDLDRGDIDLAIQLCANIWASLPGNTYGQGGHSLEALTTKYLQLLAE